MLVQLCLAVVFASFLVKVDAQNTTAQCSSSFDWANNSLGQSPCLVAAYLEGACQPGGQWTVQALPGPSYAYPDPTSDQANICSCSSVTYSLFSACADCQGALVSKWQDWTNNCSVLETSNGQYPPPVPPGTAVPSWAYQVIVGSWSPAAAQHAAQQGSPDSTAAPLPTSQPSHPSNPASHTPASRSQPDHSSSSSAASPSGTSSESSSLSYHSDLGAVIGGIVGGIAGLGLVLAFGFWLYYRRFDQLNQNALPSTGLNSSGPSRSRRDEDHGLLPDANVSSPSMTYARN